jgi:hypothetical protein
MAEPAAVETAPKRPDFVFLDRRDNLIGTGGKGFGSPNFADFPQEERVSKKSPSGDFGEVGKKIEGKGIQR